MRRNVGNACIIQTHAIVHSFYLFEILFIATVIVFSRRFVVRLRPRAVNALREITSRGFEHSFQLEIPFVTIRESIEIFDNRHQFKTEQKPLFVHDRKLYFHIWLPITTETLNRWMKNSRSGSNTIFVRKRFSTLCRLMNAWIENTIERIRVNYGKRMELIGYWDISSNNLWRKA